MQAKARIAIGLTMWCALAISAMGQSFNIDIGTATFGAAGFGPPDAAFGGAADQPGFWNNMTGTLTLPVTLNDLNGTATTATLTRSSGGGGNYAAANSNTTHGYNQLLDDAQDINAAGGIVTYTIGSLSPGNYVVYVYAIAPDSPTARSRIGPTAPHLPADEKVVGGAMPQNQFELGVTHDTLAFTLGSTGSIQFFVQNEVGSARCNGIQVVRRTFVKANATGANNGRSWTDAYTSLQSALVAGQSGQIWVAGGTYKPTTATTRTFSFQLQNYLSVYGGFDGTESRLEQRDPAANETILSGDLGVQNVVIDNSYHVVTAASTIAATAVLDGFTIQSGYANGVSPENRGGGLLLTGSPTIRNCSIQNNSCLDGGGGVYSTGSPALVNCVVRSNSNSAANFNGGGIRAGGGSLTLVNSSIIQNTTTTSGGGLAIPAASATVNAYNCIFNGNVATTNNGGGIATSGTLNLINSTVVHNDSNGGAGAGAGIRISSGTATIANTIVWGNAGSSQVSNSGTTTVTNCNVQGGFTGTGNIDADPLFADADGPDNVAGTSDDGLRVLLGSPCADTGSTALLPDDIADLDGDGITTEDLPLDFRGRPRTTGAAVDLGAYELARLYVRANATGANDGSSWTNAYTTLQAALSDAESSPVDLWIAAGTYRASTPTGLSNGAFQIPTGATLLGGFAGTETSANQRNPLTNKTILSGDVLGDDGDDFGTNSSDNSQQVVHIPQIAIHVVLDGLEIRRGIGRPPIMFARGGGVECAGQAELRQCTITSNYAHDQGGGAWVTGTLTLRKCAFLENEGRLAGGGVASLGELTVEASTFISNSSISGGGILTSGGSLQVDASAFVENYGSGILGEFNASISVQNSVFRRNEAYVSDTLSAGPGGGIRMGPGALSIANCLFIHNSAGRGGALYSVSAPSLSNNIFWGNHTRSHVGTGFQSGFEEIDVPSSTVVRNCLIHAAADVAFENGIPDQNWISVLDKDPMLTPDSRLRSGSPCINAGTAVGAPTTDIDDENRSAGGIVDIGPDEFIDSESTPDGTPDAWELKWFGLPTATSATVDSDGDGYSNRTEYNELGSIPISPPIYVSVNGNDSNFGSSSSPKRTIQAALIAVSNDSTIRLLNVGVPIFSGTGNRTLDTGGKTVVIRGEAGTNQVSLDCGGAELFNSTSPGTGRIVFDNVRIVNCVSDYGGAFAVTDGLQLRNCTITGNTATVIGGAIYGNQDTLTVYGGTIGGNTSLDEGDKLKQSQLQILADWNWAVDPLDLIACTIYGAGDLWLGPNATLGIRGDGFVGHQEPTIAYTDIRGTGNIVIDSGQELRLVNGATIDLSGASGSSTCSCPATLNAGTVTVNGKLIASGGRVQNTNVVVNQGEIGDGAFIVHNDISLPQTVPATASTAGFGGEFFVENDSTICCNHIVSYGDRYLDIDPNPDLSVPNPDVQNNTIDVIITQSTADGLGELLELRAFDHNGEMPCPGLLEPCAIQLAASPGYSDTWAINELQVRENGRVTLTNRKNFDFNPGTRDTIYIKTLVLYPNSVFNVGLQRAYYQTLKLADSAGNIIDPNPAPPYVNGAQIVDVPLLGFSLKVINFEDETAAPFNEADIRLRTRVQDDPTLDPALPSTPLGSVGRVTWNGRKGLSMDTQVDGHPSVSMVAIKGSFARAGEDEIEVSFIYDWRGLTPSSSRLRVYLSDSPEVGQNLGPLLATISPPTSGSGTVTGVSWATFTGKFPRGNLDLRRGTFIELQLTGDNAHITIDDFDPLVCGSIVCGDIGGDPSYDWTVSGVDFLYLLAEQGKISGGTNYCADLMSGDKYVDLSDLLLWDSQLQNVNANLCQTISSSPAALPTANVAATLPPQTLLVAGKSAQLQTQLPSGEPDRFPALLFGLDPGSAISGTGALPPGASQIADALGHGRLARNASGALFQLHGGFGLMRLSDGAVVAPRGDMPCANPPSQVHVGIWTTGDVPLLDAAFDRTDPSVVYVTPVHVVDAANPAQIYHASARIKLLSTPGAYNVERVYGQNPYAPGASNTEPPMLASVNVQHQREIETDGLGNLFALSAMSTLNNDNNWLLLYRASDAFERRILLPSTLAAPSAMLVTSDNQKLYIAAGLSGTSSAQAKVYRFTIVRNGNEATGVTLDNTNGYTVSGMRQVTALAEGLNGAIYAVGFQAPTFDVNHAFANDADLFTTPAIAQLPAAIGNVTAHVIVGGNLALPISVVLANTGCPGPVGDFNGDQVVNAADVPGFVNVMLNGAGGPGPTLCRADFNADQQANGRDISGFVQAVVP